MQPVSRPVAKFIADNHVVSLAVHDADGLWAASCFYVFDEEKMLLVILTDTGTRHGRAMLEHPAVAGTIAGQPEQIRDICGIQFTARAECLPEGAAHQAALARYTRSHPMAKLVPADVWALHFESIKYTDNKYVFAHKIYWRRNGADG
ncbi:hypothetical protein BWD09_04930 [Neisseria dentiae]|uniref:Pyridoxamine 5'-phosphate oxidase N-terminal domain-containing protein n=1 Tax=Neisseria dentiae TaxID=194197 RepID=A0A1X3DCX1_9NEIS|nr:pyridoxamine 5'-phosphate oxidase family protein [Neisseria dentiae]OSI17778.1 hypothetical protein BWD09_04930 [Neisseria dentiae]QMT44681.1 pyridoxamine 5'-phosphate oxidase family protein [Neisseria dentiae]STZ50392.1 Uncharacterized protein conserved in bacteria [Neisseria dentiae]